MKKARMLAAVMAVLMAMTALPAEALAEGTETPAAQAETHETAEAYIPADAAMTNDEAFAGYVASVFYPEEPQFSAAEAADSAGNALTGVERGVYDTLASCIRAVAAGESASTVFILSGDNCPALCTGFLTAADLGVSDLGTGPYPAYAADEALWARVDFDMFHVLDALLADLPYELYWYDKTAAIGPYYEGDYEWTVLADGTAAVSLTAVITLAMPVSADYVAEGSTYSTDSARLATVRTAAANAAAVVQTHSGESDLQKLISYRDEICARTDYNDAAAADGDTPYGDPWQLIYVFDGIESTTVVCEGYSKAFKYLCDMSEFASPRIYARLVSGDMGVGDEPGGGHMWNVVTMPDGRNYLVDVTNMDDGIGDDGSFFLNGYEGVSDGGRTYRFACMLDEEAFYTYDDDTLATFAASELALSPTDYEEVTAVDISDAAVVAAIPDQVYDGTGKRPAPVVTYEGGTLTEGTDYTVDYQNNTNAGTAEVTITFCGAYTGSVTARFTITKGRYDMSGVTFPNRSFVYDSEAHSLAVSGTLPEGVTVSYEGNAQTEIGSYTVTAHFTGDTVNYEPIGDMTATMEIVRNDIVDSGTCGKHLTWTLTGSGSNLTLTISGTGDMYDYSQISTPWHDYVQKITTVAVEEGVTGIGNWAFNCYRLTDVTLPSTLTRIGTSAFNGCSCLEEIVIPDGVTKMGNYVFSECGRLTDVTLPAGLTQMGGYVFFNCTRLTEIVIPDGVTVLGDGTFSGCSSLTDVTLPSGLTEIMLWAFMNCSALEHIDLPATLTTLGEGVFHSCSSLVEADLPEGVTSIPESTFDVCSSLERVTIPESVESIGPYAFIHCNSLAEITVPGTVKSIGKLAFSACQILSDITLEEGLESIGDEAFSSDMALTSITIPNSVTSMGDRVFEFCRNLRSIFLPAGLTEVGSGMFSYCDSLEVVCFGGSKAQWEALGIAVPDGCVVVYNATFLITGLFTDVRDPEQFYFMPIYWAAEQGITTGWDDGTFRPLNNCNRAAVVTFLWRLAGEPEPSSMATFRDMTGNATFDKAISWAVEEGITTGWADNTFRPWNTCNRAAIVTFLWRYAGEPAPSSTATFRDMTGNTDFDRAISWAAENGITTGWAADNTFRPWNTCNRLSVVTFLYRMYLLQEG